MSLPRSCSQRHPEVLFLSGQQPPGERLAGGHVPARTREKQAKGTRPCCVPRGGLAAPLSWEWGPPSCPHFPVAGTPWL